MIVEIEGVQWQLIEREKPKSHLGMKSALMALALSQMPVLGYNSYSRSAPEVDLVEEFKLIQQKKSNLSKRDRDWVIYQFNRNFRKINPADNAA